MREFRDLDDYYLMNGGSHLKPSARIGPPALAYHVSLWIPDRGRGYVGSGPDTERAPAPASIGPGPDAEPVDYENRRRLWLEYVDWFLASFVRRAYELWEHDCATGTATEGMRPTAFSEHGDQAQTVALFRHRVTNLSKASVKSLEFKKLSKGEADQYRNETFSFKFFYHGIPMKLRASLHSEFVSFTLIAELHAAQPEVGEDAIRAKLKKNFRRIADSLPKRFRKLSSGRRDRHHDSDMDPHEITNVIDELGEAPNFLYRGFWDSFWTEYHDCLQARFSVHIVDVEKSSSQAFDAAQSLRDRIGTVFGDFRGVVLSGGLVKDSGQDRKSALMLDMPFEKIDNVTQATLEKPSDGAESLALMDSLLPMLEAAQIAAARRKTAAGETSQFRMGMEHSAARFLNGRAMYLSSLSAHRPGSTTSESNDSHEPLCYLVLFPRRNRWQLGRLIERLHLLGSFRLASLKDLPKLNRANYELRNFSEARRAAASSEAYDELNERLRKIEADFDDGIGYRIERSRYYVSSFRALVPSLRIKRVEGYQPYDEFVSRRLGSTWDFIDRLGNRLERARRQIDSINVEIQARAQRRQTIEQTELLVFAEIAGIVPIGYYGGLVLHSFAAAFGFGNPLHLADPDARNGVFIAASMVSYVVLLLVIKPVISAIRTHRSRFDRDDRNR